jgi:hypothetical protein
MEQTIGTIVDPQGNVATRPTVILSPKDAQLLRDYKRFLQKYQLREALYCNACYEGTLADGCQAFVNNQQIGILCRCTMRVYEGQTL